MSTIRATMTHRLLGEASGPLTGIYVVTHRTTGSCNGRQTPPCPIRSHASRNGSCS